MKKLLVILLSWLLTLSLCACGAGPSPEVTPAPTDEGGETAADEVLSKGTGFEITLHRTESSTKYNYVITANDGTVIERASCSMQPKVAPLSKDLLGFRFFNETGSWCRYYDLARGLASQSFFGAFWDNGRLVAYNDFEANGRLVVQDIFDENGYRCEIPIENNAMELTVTAAVLNDDATALTVEYIPGKTGSRLTVEIPLE